MKQLFITIAMMLTGISANAQEVKVVEPEFINSYCILTSDSTFATLPKESGVIGKHENKVKKWSKWIGGAADIVGAGGMRNRKRSCWFFRHGHHLQGRSFAILSQT